MLADVHNHFGGALAYSMAIGGSHWESFGNRPEMAGPTPEFFFAPGQIEKRNRDWGSGEPMRRVMEAFAKYVTFTDEWLSPTPEFLHERPVALRCQPDGMATAPAHGPPHGDARLRRRTGDDRCLGPEVVVVEQQILGQPAGEEETT